MVQLRSGLMSRARTLYPQRGMVGRSRPRGRLEREYLDSLTAPVRTLTVAGQKARLTGMIHNSGQQANGRRSVRRLALDRTGEWFRGGPSTRLSLVLFVVIPYVALMIGAGRHTSACEASGGECDLALLEGMLWAGGAFAVVAVVLDLWRTFTRPSPTESPARSDHT